MLNLETLEVYYNFFYSNKANAYMQRLNFSKLISSISIFYQ